MHTHAHAHTQTHTHAHTHKPRAHTHAHTHTKHAHTNKPTHKHTHTHTHIYIVSRADILQLVQLVFTVMTAAMQDDPANKMFFESNVSGRVQVPHIM